MTSVDNSESLGSIRRASTGGGGRRPSILWSHPIQEVTEEAEPGAAANASTEEPISREPQPLMRVSYEAIEDPKSELEDLNFDPDAIMPKENEDAPPASSRRSSMESEKEEPVSQVESGLEERRGSAMSGSVSVTESKTTGRRLSVIRRPSLVGIPYTNRFTRRSSVSRRSIILPPIKQPEAIMLEELIPAPQEPRFAATLSLEAQFALFKSYEDTLASKLAKAYPEKRSQLSRTQTPKNRRICLKVGGNDEFGADDSVSMMSSDIESVRGPFITTVGGRSQLPSKRSEMSPQPGEPHSTTDRWNNTPAAAQSLTSSIEVPTRRQLNLTRRFQMAQSLLDTLNAVDTNAGEGVFVGTVPTNQRVRLDKFNAIQGYQWWSASWNSDFELL